MPASENIVAAEDVTIAYGEAVALKGFSLAIAPGEIVGLIGEAACGKTTAALALLGLVRPPGKVVAGRIDFGGRDLLRLSKTQLQTLRGKDVGLIVQNPRSALNPMLPIGQQIETVYRTHNVVTKAQARAHAIKMLASVGINDPERRVHAYPHEISGGMAQRVLIAIALSSKPKLLIADEPTSGLDVTIQAQFLDQMWHTVRSAGSAMLLVTQDIGIIANYCDRILVMQDGQVVEQGGVNAFFDRPVHPYSRAILAMQAERVAMGREEVGVRRGGVPLIEVRDMVKHFALRGTRKKLQAVGGVSLTIAAGETLGLVGESGSGKTTVGRCILGLIRPDSGVLLHRGRVVDSVIPRALRPKLQIVFQDPYDTLDPRWTVSDLLGEPLKLHFAMRTEAREQRIAELLDLVGLEQATAAARPRMLSAGQQQRVGIARALACEPELIVLDEPTSALAPAARTAIVALLRDLQARLGLSYLFISHDLATVRHVSHRIAVMYLSQIVEIGERDDIFERPRHPYTRALLAAHLDADPQRRRPEHPPASRLEGEIPSPVDLPPGCFLAGRCPDEQAVCRTQKQVLADFSGGRAVRCWRATQEQPLELLHQ